MNPKQVIVPVEKRRNFESHLKFMNCLRHVVLGLIYLTKSAMGSVEMDCLFLE